MADLIGYDAAALVERARARVGNDRYLLGITGPPGAGKSTLAGQLADALGDCAQRVPMDGFHLADAELTRLGRAERKGAPDTFDRAGFVVALLRLRAREHDVYLPEFRRDIEAAIAGSIAIASGTAVLLVEGNYLLHWPEVRAELDEIWYLDPPAGPRVESLIARHVAFGRTPAAALEWVLRSDEANAALVERDRDAADVIIRARAWPPG